MIKDKVLMLNNMMSSRGKKFLSKIVQDRNKQLEIEIEIGYKQHGI